MFIFYSRIEKDAAHLRELIIDKENDGYSLSQEDCLKFFKASFLLKDYNGVLDFLTNWMNSGNTLTLPLVNQAMKAYWKLGDLASCFEAFQQLEKVELIPDSHSFGVLIAAFLKKANFVKAREYATEMFASTKVCPSSFNFVIGEFANNNDWFGTRLCLELGSKNGISPRLTTLTTLIRASIRNYQLSKMKSLKQTCGRQEELGVINKIYLGLRDSKIPLDKVSFCAFVSWYVSIGFVAEASYVVEDMDRLGQPPDLREYSLLIKGYSKKSQWSNVLSVYNVIKEKGLGMNEAVYGSIVKALLELRGRNPEKYLHDMRNGTLAHTTIVFNICIDLFCRQGNFAEAYRIYQYMQERKVECNLFTYTQFFEGMCLLRQEAAVPKKDWEEFRLSTLEIFKTIFSDLKARSFQGDLPLYNMMVNSFSYLEDLDSAQEVYDYMTHFLGLIPDCNTFYSIARAAVTGIGVSSAVDAIRSSLDSKHARLLYYTFINGFVLGRETGKAVALYRRMRALSLCENDPSVTGLPSLDAASFVKLIHGSLKEMDDATALELFQDLHSSNLPVPVLLLHSLSKHIAHLEGLANIDSFKGLLQDLYLRLPLEEEYEEFDDAPEPDWQGKSVTYKNFRYLSLDVYHCLLELSEHPEINLTDASTDPGAISPMSAASCV
ncbi:hypothetical protein DSO57_1037399 [Entomophthora muscae]|uniref:Uncharacterized protein n=1 Tax=Entomophthora muscae TaxID=34485 RepID=A0ACC2RPX2_9FUNG|nr:hypothetical protein DSO57_1037399 [Entomophthora muscae]